MTARRRQPSRSLEALLKVAASRRRLAALMAMERSRGLSASGVGRKVRLQPAAVALHLRRLEVQGLAAKRRLGNTMRFTLTQRGTRLLEWLSKAPR